MPDTTNPAKPLTTTQHTILYACKQWSDKSYKQAKRAASIAITTPPGPDSKLERRFWRDAACSELAMAIHWRQYARRTVGVQS